MTVPLHCVCAGMDFVSIQKRCKISSIFIYNNQVLTLWVNYYISMKWAINVLTIVNKADCQPNTLPATSCSVRKVLQRYLYCNLSISVITFCEQVIETRKDHSSENQSLNLKEPRVLKPDKTVKTKTDLIILWTNSQTWHFCE